MYPTMFGVEGWYGWRDTPWNVGTLEVWYWSQRADDLPRVESDPWVGFLQGRNPGYPEQALERMTLSNSIAERVAHPVTSAFAAIAVQFFPQDMWRRGEAWLVARPVAFQGIAIGALIVAADAAVGQQGVAPFIYFQF